jgi:beta-barrel assembly-enhancing protease
MIVWKCAPPFSVSKSACTLLIAAGLGLAPAGVYAQSSSAPPQSAPPAQDASAGGSQPASSSASSAQAASPGASDAAQTATKDTSKGKDKKKDKAQASPQAPPPDPQLPPPGVQPGKDGVMPGVRPGSIEDVNAVGVRDIGGRGIGNWYGTDTEIKMGRAYAAEIEKSTHFITDPVVTEYINRIGQNLVKNSDAKVPFTIKVIDSDEINAMALPGGFFYVNSGLILAADSEAELASVMAHEIAHVAAHHAMREQTRANYAQLGTIPLIFIGGWAGYGIYEAASIGIPLTFLEFSREFEAQADYLGVEYLYRAGYDPTAMVSFFEKIEALEKQKPGAVSRAFASHPQTPDRIEHSEEEIARILPPRPEYLEDTSEFEEVKARLARIENKRKLMTPGREKKPSLRRASTTAPNSPANDGGAAPPTLHRPDSDGGLQ